MFFSFTSNANSNLAVIADEGRRYVLHQHIHYPLQAPPYIYIYIYIGESPTNTFSCSEAFELDRRLTVHLLLVAASRNHEEGHLIHGPLESSPLD